MQKFLTFASLLGSAVPFLAFYLVEHTFYGRETLFLRHRKLNLKRKKMLDLLQYRLTTLIHTLTPRWDFRREAQSY